MKSDRVATLAATLAANRAQGVVSDIALEEIEDLADALALQMAALDAYSTDLDGYTLVGTNPGCRRSLGLGHPLDAIVWLAEELAQQGKRIHAGAIVATGSCTPIPQALPGQQLDADFGPIGRIRCHFS